MLYRCINELSLKIEDVQDSVTVKRESTPKAVRMQQQQPRPQPIQQKQIYKESPRKKTKNILPPISPEHNKPTVTETLIFQVSPPPPPLRPRVTSSTIEEIDTDSDSDVDVESIKIKPTDLDKELEAELEELDS